MVVDSHNAPCATILLVDDGWTVLVGPAAALLGAALGGGLALLSERSRWKREREARLSDHRQAVIVELLNAVNDVVGRSGTIADGLKQAHDTGATIAIDISALDRAITTVSQKADELRVLGPREVADSALMVFDAAVDVRDGVARFSSQADQEALARRAYEAKMTLLRAAATRGLAEHPGPASVSSRAR